MFTDIQGFARLAEERGGAFSNQVRQQHDAILVPLIERARAGRVIKHIGDAVMAVFSQPSTAVAWALEIQAQYSEYKWPEPARFKKGHPDQGPFPLDLCLFFHPRAYSLCKTYPLSFPPFLFGLSAPRLSPERNEP